LRRIVAFMPEKRDYHCEWRGDNETFYKLDWMARLRPQYQRDFLSERERKCLEYLFQERLHRFVSQTGLYGSVSLIKLKELQEWALDQRRHLSAWLAWLGELWYNRGKEIWVYKDFDWLELDPRPLIYKIKEVKGGKAVSDMLIYHQNCPDEYRVDV
ncbi:MAG: hypothetical protein LUJ25_11030, partial [Firmicutes bacterium]|nr:hypothetical protein [Bacillota bacterium]